MSFSVCHSACRRQHRATCGQDNDQNGVYSSNIDSGFEGIVVSLYRSVGSTLTFLGCTNTDSTGACSGS